MVVSELYGQLWAANSAAANGHIGIYLNIHYMFCCHCKYTNKKVHINTRVFINYTMHDSHASFFYFVNQVRTWTRFLSTGTNTRSIN